MGTALFAGIGLGVMPHALYVTLTYNDHAKLKKGIIISCIVFTPVQGIICGIVPLTYALNPNLVTRDYTTIYVASNLLPAWVGGIIFCGVFAAIQSSIAGLCMASGAVLAKDFIIDCFKPETSDKVQGKINLGVILGVGAIGIIVALKPTDLTQYMINFALGAIASAWYWPVLCGMYWKKATKTGMFLSTALGYASYILFCFLSSVIPYTKDWWAASLGGLNAFVPAWIVSLIFMVAGSIATQKDKTPLGYFQVFFCDDYDESYAKMK